MINYYNTDQNPNHWSGRGMKLEDSSNSPYYQQPVHNPYLDEKFAIAAICCGALAMFCSCAFMLPIAFSSLGFLFAALAHRKGKRHSILLKNGILFSAVGLLIGVVSGVTFFTSVLPRTLENPVNRQQIGMMIDTYLNLMEDAYGIDLGTSAEEIMDSIAR